MNEPHNLGAARCKSETSAAILVHVDELGEALWVPKSQVHDDSEVYAEGHSGDLVVTEWFARQKGWA